VTPAAVEVAAPVAAADSPQRITVPSHRVGDGPGDLDVVEAEALGHPGHLPADVLGRQGGDYGGGIDNGDRSRITPGLFLLSTGVRPCKRTLGVPA